MVFEGMDQIINQSIKYQVEADPETLSFPWTLSNGRETTLLPEKCLPISDWPASWCTRPDETPTLANCSAGRWTTLANRRSRVDSKSSKKVWLSSSMYRFDIVHAACCVAYSIRIHDLITAARRQGGSILLSAILIFIVIHVRSWLF